MTVATIHPVPGSEFRKSIEKLSGQKTARCYQCGKCTAGCPVSYVMDLAPRRVMRAIQIGLKEEVLASNSIWLCVHCQMCSARCPREIDIARVMEACRLLYQQENPGPGDKDIETFHRLFLDTIKRWGRLSEPVLAATYNLSSGHLFANLGMVPALMSKGKLAMPRQEGAAEVARIMRNVEAEKANKRKPASGEKA